MSPVRTTTEARDPRPATHDLEAALREVQAALDELLVAADEQYAAVVARDRDRIESVTRQQERLSGRLARAERQRLALQGQAPLNEVIAALPTSDAVRVDSLRSSIAGAVLELKGRQEQSAQLLAKSIELTRQTLDFVQRLVTPASPVYGRQPVQARQSLIVELRA
jgi:flagellar biosynthesis/type III secretory pathway chaperone